MTPTTPEAFVIHFKSFAALLAGGGLVAAAATVPFTASTTTRSESGAFSAFGRSVAIAGEFAFVGEPNVGGGRGGGGAPPMAGVVHIYRYSATVWKAVGELRSSSAVGGDGFGSAMAAEGATLLVGQVSAAPVAPNAGRGGGGGGGRGGPPAAAPPDTAVGSVQLFRRGADMKWTASGKLAATDVAGAQFGAAIALAGDLAMVGAPGLPSGGAVYVFQRVADGSWRAEGALPAQGLLMGDRFGASIAHDGNRVVVGAPARKGKGAIFLFKRDASGTWVQETEQVAPQNLPDRALFGAAVAVKGDRVIAGAPGTNFTAPPSNASRDSLMTSLLAATTSAARDSIVARLTAMAAAGGGRGNAGGGGGRGGAQVGLATGMVMVFERASFGSWRMVGTLAPFDFGNASFGATLRVVGGDLWIGAPGSDGAGRIYRARADADGAWTGMTKLGVDTIDAGAQWSASFAVSGDKAIVGMPGDGGGGGTVAFLGRTPANDWTLRALNTPPIPYRFPMVTGAEVKCGTDGKAASFECSNTGLLSYLPISAVGGKRGVNLSGSWGWTDPVTGHDISIIGRTDGAAFVDVTDPVRPRYLGDLLRTKGANMSSWREIKTYKNYALIVSDGSGDHHGIQIFDLTRLRNVKAPKRFTEDAHFDAGSIHDIAVNEQSGYAYAVGTASGGERCGGGSLMIDMREPLKPTFAGCFADIGTGRARGGYSHDIQCVMYRGPDKRYTGHEICMASNETTVSIQDVTDKKNVKVLSRADYPTPGYTHQGWFTEDQRYWYLNDETDETGNIGRSAEGTRTMIFDVADLEQPIMKKEYIGPTHASDHNLYVKGDRMYQSNYKAGLRILDVSDPVNPKEIGFLDTNPGENSAGFQGSWNNYPFFKNGAIGVVSIGEGFFMVRDAPPRKVVP